MIKVADGALTQDFSSTGMILAFYFDDFCADLIIHQWVTHEHVRGKPTIPRIRILYRVPAYWLTVIHPLEFTPEEKDTHKLLESACHRRLALVYGAPHATRCQKVSEVFFGDPETL